MNASPEPEFVKVEGAQELIPPAYVAEQNQFFGVYSWAP